jgi:molybdenum cofactor cytidylyltransferase
LEHETSNSVIVILAAGASSRMETPKQLLRWGEDTLITHTIKTALKVKDSEVIVVLGAHYELIEKEIKQYPITILKNKDWQLGLGKSIACSADYILNSNPKVDSMLVTLADQPLIDAKFLDRLINTFQKNKACIVATLYEKGANGVPAIFDKKYFEELLILNDDKGAKHLLKKYKSSVKTLIPELENVDLDIKADYDMLYKKKFSI